MRNPCALVLLVLFSWIGGLGQDARAGVTVDVLFQDATVPSGITAISGDPGPGCTFTGYYAGSVSAGWCMDVMLQTTDDLVDFSVSVTYDTDDGLALASMYEWKGVGVSFDKNGAAAKLCAPAGGLVDNGGILQSFDCTIPEPNNPPVLAPGTYRIGTIVWDTTGLSFDWDRDHGYFDSELIAAYIDGAVDGFSAVRNGNIVDISNEVMLGMHGFIGIPEPGTAALLGLGLVGLALTARRH